MLLLLFTLTTSIVIFTIGLFTFLKNTHSKYHLLFFLFNLSVALWTIANFLSLSEIQSESAFFWVRTTMFLAVWQGTLFFLFVHTFPNIKIHLKKFVLWLVLGLATIISFLCYTPLVFSDYSLENSKIEPIVGPGIILFMLNSIGLIVLGVIILFLRKRSAKGLLKNQLRYILLGSFFMFLLLIFFNFILVNLFHNTSFVDYGVIYTFPFIVASLYAIVKYRLMDIRVAFTRSIVFAALVFLVSASFVSTTLLGTRYLESDSRISDAVLLFITSVVIVIFLNPIKIFLAKITDRIFFKNAIDYQSVTKKLTDVINREFKLSDLVSEFSAQIKKELKLGGADIFLPVGGNNFISSDDFEPSQKILKIFGNNFLMDYLRSNLDDILILDELDRKISESIQDTEKTRFENFRISLEEAEASAVIPIGVNNTLDAVLVLHEKLSGESLSQADLEVLQVIAPQLASGIEKARLYQEQKEFGDKLKREVEKATVELREANKHLSELDNAKSEFMSIASHQLRTPLAGIQGYLSMVLDGDYGKVNKTNKPVLEDVLHATQRLIRMVNVFLNVTRIEAGRFVMNFTKTAFHQVMDDVYKTLKPTAEKKGVKLTYKKVKLPEAEIDVDKIKDVLINLTDNAIKYSPEGKVSMSAEVVDNGKNIHVKIKDTGVGIAPKEAKNLFSKFVRGSGIARVEPNGSGLGLFIAKRITEGHGGKIWVESEGEGKGSTFQFVVPVKADTKAKKEAEDFKARAKKE